MKWYIMKLSQTDIDNVNARLFDLFTQNELKKTDIALVMGGRSTSGNAARKAAELYHQGAISKIMVAGGKKIFEPAVLIGLMFDFKKAVLDIQNLKDIISFKSEADYMRKVLLAAGIPENDIIIGDNKETHADKIINAIKGKLQSDFNSATIVTYAPYIRRVIGTLRFQGVEMPLETSPVNAFGLTPQNWHTSSLANIIARESRNMDPFNKSGYVGKFCTEVDITQEEGKRAALPSIAI
jgi:uncharacterized SAM-binding protein YcdF (DUF218 family)